MSRKWGPRQNDEAARVSGPAMEGLVVTASAARLADYDIRRPDFAATCHPDTVILYDYWRWKCGTQAMPSRADIDPVDMPRRLLPFINLVDVVSDERRYIYRLVGTGHV